MTRRRARPPDGWDLNAGRSAGHASFRLQERHAPCRGRSAAADRGGGRNALLLLLDGDTDAPLRDFRRGFPGCAAMVCYAMKANSNLAVLRILADARRRDGRGLGRRAAAGAGRRRARRAHHVLGCRQDGARARLRARRRTSSASTSNRSRSSSSCRRLATAKGLTARVSLRINPDVDAEHAPQDRHRQVREQVRHPDHAGARGLCDRRQAAGAEGHRRRHAYRQPDHRARAL